MNISVPSISNTFVDELAGDPVEKNYPRQVYQACYSKVKPTTAKNPSKVIYSDELRKKLGLNNIDEDSFLQLMSGNASFEGAINYAMCYGGHQFGAWAGQLGDGRAINIGEVNACSLQLKGAGPTPYSRTADGFAVLRSSIREFLCSEAMHHLGIPTTRALSLVLTGDMVVRDMLYDGNLKEELGAIVCRVSESFIRFGNFEIFAARNDKEQLQKLTDYTIKHHFTHITSNGKEAYLDFFKEVCQRTAKMIVDWQRVGFVHGVMNTDNMSILGQTIDYGPYGWIDNFDVNWTPNTTDNQHKRYRFGQQAAIALWNLNKLANALFPIIEDAKALETILKDFSRYFVNDYYQMLNHKLGLKTKQSSDEQFQQELLYLMGAIDIDMTLFYRNLSKFSGNIDMQIQQLEKDAYCSSIVFKENRTKWEAWLKKYQQRIKEEKITNKERVQFMNTINPKYVLRNYMAQMAIEQAEKGDYSLLYEFYQLLQNPYDEQADGEKWFAKRPDWAKDKIGASQLSCSS